MFCYFCVHVYAQNLKPFRRFGGNVEITHPPSQPQTNFHPFKVRPQLFEKDTDSFSYVHLSVCVYPYYLVFSLSISLSLSLSLMTLIH